MDDYDEVITDNPFYKAFQSKAKQLYSLAADNRWLVSVRYSVISLYVTRRYNHGST